MPEPSPTRGSGRRRSKRTFHKSNPSYKKNLGVTNWCKIDVQLRPAEGLQSFVVKNEGHITLVQESMGGQKSVVWLDNTSSKKMRVLRLCKISNYRRDPFSSSKTYPYQIQFLHQQSGLPWNLGRFRSCLRAFGVCRWRSSIYPLLRNFWKDLGEKTDVVKNDQFTQNL